MALNHAALGWLFSISMSICTLSYYNGHVRSGQAISLVVNLGLTKSNDSARDILEDA